MPLTDKIQDKTAIIGVMGLGYVGLPLAIAFAREGFDVEGFDIDAPKVTALRRGHTMVEGVDLTEFRELLMKGKLNFWFTPLISWNIDVAIICVPTPITDDKKPDLSYIKATVELLKGHIQQDRDSMVVLESSTYPGTTRELILNVLKGRVRHVAYSPERIDPGNKEYDIRNTPKLVGGIDKESTELATALYSCIVDKIVPVSSVEMAETAKLFENVFRNVNIALVNELAMICEKVGVSVWEVIDAATTKPFGFMPFYPGVGVSGHCLPLDPYYLLDRAETHGASAKLIGTALSINEAMPERVFRWMEYEHLDFYGRKLDLSRILVLGVTYKRDIGDTRESAPIELIKILSENGARVLYNDPYVPRLTGWLLSSEELTDELLASMDCVVITTDHSCYDWQWIVDKAKLVFDTRNATKGIVSKNIRRLGEKGAEDC